jgi:4-hydroxy-2-oxovalerate aldolase
VYAFPSTPQILEVTLRDGSYVIDFQFTANDTALIAGALESVGFRWIEVAHGLGLRASLEPSRKAAATDEEYLEATASTLKEAKWGVFCIPGIATVEDLHIAAKYDMPFVRIGTNVTEAHLAEPFIKEAKNLGMIVSFNAMKSYAVTPEEFGDSGAKVADWGADIVCIVDSAGGMFPEDIEAYMSATQKRTEVPLGFHGHNNLAMSMANTLRAIDCGAVLVDSSLCGMGRSAGNTVTEILVAVMKQRELASDIDLNGVMDLGQGLIAPIMQSHGLDPLGITSGYAQFHSSFTPKVRSYADKHGIDMRDLIVRLCEEDLVNAPDDLLEKLGKELANNRISKNTRIATHSINRISKSHSMDGLQDVLREQHARAVKSGKHSVLNIVIGEHPMENATVSSNISPTPTHMISSVTLTKEDDLEKALLCADGQVDVVFLDMDRKPFGPKNQVTFASSILKESTLLTYFDSRTWVQAIEDQVVRILGEDLEDVSIVIAGSHQKSQLLAQRLTERFAKVALLLDPGKELTSHEAMANTNASNFASYEVLEADCEEATVRLGNAPLTVGWPDTDPWFGIKHVSALSSGNCLIDARIGAILPEAFEIAHNANVKLIRVNIWSALAGTVAMTHDSAMVCQVALGSDIFNDVPVVAGGLVGREGDVVIDNLKSPTRVIGVADGCGGLIEELSNEYVGRVQIVSEEINRRLILPHLS